MQFGKHFTWNCR